METEKEEQKEAKRIAVYTYDDVLEMCEQDIGKTTANTRSQFICDAVKYYHAYLNKELNSEVLAPSIEEVVGAKIDLTEYRISRIIFKLAVEMAATMNVLAGAFELDDEKVRRMKHRVIQEVKELNGWINLEDIIRYQNGEA